MTSDFGGNGNDPDIETRLSHIEDRLAAVEQALSALARTRSAPIEHGPTITATAAAGPPLPPPPAPGSTPLQGPVPTTGSVPPPPSPPVGPSSAARPTAPRITAELALRWAGVVLVFFAALFLVSTAVSRGWIGPEVQLALATVGGAALIGTGVHLEHRFGGERRPWSLALANTGVLVLATCAGAAHGWLDLVGAGTAVVLVALVLALALVLADWFSHESLAICGLAGALFTPAFIGGYDFLGDVGTGAWLLMLVAVTMALAGRYGWSAPRMLGLVVIGPFMVALTDGLVEVSGSLLAVVQGMIAVAGLLWWLAPWLRPPTRTLRSIDHRLVFVVPGLIWLASSGLWATTDREEALAATAVAAGFGAVTWLTTRFPALGFRSIRVPDRDLGFGHLVGISSLVTVALALWFDGPILLSALAVQGLGTTALAVRSGDRLLQLNAAVLGAVIGTWTAIGILDGIDDGLAAADAVVYVLVLAAAAGSAWLIRLRSIPVAGLTVVAAWAGLLAWVMAVLRPLPQGQMLVSIVWAALGAGLVVLGLGLWARGLPAVASALHQWRTPIKSLGLATVAATVVKLVTIDLAEVDTIWRALLFAVVGVGLLRLGYRIGLLERSDHEPLAGATSGRNA